MSHIICSDGTQLHFYIPPSPPAEQVAWCLRDIARLNAYRTLGLCVNASQKEQLAHTSRIAAFLRVQRPVSFPADAMAKLAAPLRTEESVARAAAELSQPARRLQHAPFWFFRLTPLDAEAWEHMAAGRLEEAQQLWRAAEDPSARHNLALSLLLSNQADEAIPLLEALYAEHSQELGRLVDASLTPTEEEWVEAFLSTIQEKNTHVLSMLADWVSRPAWKKWLSRYAEASLLRELEVCREGNTPKERFRSTDRNTGTLFGLLNLLKDACGKDDATYRNLADRAATEVLLAAIAHFNAEEMSYWFALEVESLMQRARDMACSPKVRKRCKENLATVVQARKELPAAETGEDGEAVYRRVRSLARGKADLAAVRLMLREVAPGLRAVKKKLGAQHEAYLRLSDLVVQYAQAGLNMVLSSAMEEMLEAEKRMNEAEVVHGIRLPLPSSLNPAAKDFFAVQTRVKLLLREAWDILRELEFYDMEPGFRRETYEKGRASVERLCRQASIQTDYFADTLRRHPSLYAVFALIALVILGGFWWLMSETQTQTHELRRLEQQAQTMADWQAVADAAQANTMASGRSTVLARATRRLRELKEAEEKRLAREQELVKHAQGAQESIVALEHFTRLAAEYCLEFGNEAGDTIPTLVQQAQQRIEELQQEQRRQQVDALLRRYREASTFTELEAFITAAATLRTQDAELERCCTEAAQRAETLKAAREEELRTRLDSARTAAEYDALAQEARAGQNAIPALGELADRAQQAAEACREQERKQEEERLWGTEAKAWASVQQKQNSPEACRQYLERYPTGKHAPEARKRVIDAEVEDVFSSGLYGKLPQTQRTRASRSSTASISIRNDTEHTLTILYSGKRSDKLVIPPRGSSSLRLPADTYRIVASVDARGVRPFAGTETYRGGSYEASYYISTSPVRSYTPRSSSPSSGWPPFKTNTRSYAPFSPLP